MKKFIPLIAVAFIAAVILLSVIPDYKQSQRPFNKLVTFAKAEGFALAVLMPEASMEEKAREEVIRLGVMVKRDIPVKYFSGAEADEIASENRVSVPGYLLMDGDGNVAVRGNDVLKAQELAQYFSELHTH